MRLLQLATRPGELIDLHPNVTVVAGLDEHARAVLTDVVAALAQGRAVGTHGLLEAHGVLFDLSPEMVGLLDIKADDLDPVVTAGDVPTTPPDPKAGERAAAALERDQAEERWATSVQQHTRALAALAATRAAVERARRAVDEAVADAAGRIDTVDSVASELDHAIEQRRRVTELIAELEPQVEQAAAARADVEAATTEVRTRRHEAAARCSELAARLDAARMGQDPAAEADAERAAEELAKVEAEVEAEREAERQAAELAASTDGEPPMERLVRIQQSIEELYKRLAAFAPNDVHQVAHALDHLRSVQDGGLVPMPEAVELADELAALERGLAGARGGGATPDDLAAGRARLDDARQALLEAEQAARNPELDRELVDQLEHAHADLLDAIDRADGRLGGARAQRRVDNLRAVENAVLDEMGFATYAEYMMGYSLLHVDPAIEAALDAARAQLASAEDAWAVLEAETEAELARAEVMEHRRTLIEEARGLLSRPVPARSILKELRSLQVEAQAPPAIVDGLRLALDGAGVAIDSDDLERDDLVLVAEAWLDETSTAVAREEEMRSQQAALEAERAELLALIEAENARAAEVEGRSPEDLRRERVSAAEATHRAAQDRVLAHRTSEAAVAEVADELADAVEAERIAAVAAAEADDVVAAACAHDDAVRAELARLEQELAAAVRAEADGNEQMRAHAEGETPESPQDLADALTHAVEAVAADERVVDLAERTVSDLHARHVRAIAAVEALQDGHSVVDGGSTADEVEWYLLARLAAQRSVSLGGSLPLVLDDALGGLDAVEAGRVLSRLERMAEAVQVIVVTDDEMASSWAMLAGSDRAAVVRPERASTA